MIFLFRGFIKERNKLILARLKTLLINMINSIFKHQSSKSFLITLDCILIIIFLTTKNNLIKKIILNIIIITDLKFIFNMLYNILKLLLCQEKNYDIIRQKMTDVIIPTKSASSAAYKTKLVFFTLVTPVYNAIVYNVVSVEPIIVEAIRPIFESGP